MNRCIKVGGEKKIPINSMGKAIIEINNRKLIFQKCLYIPGLKINLLSTRRFYKQDLKGSFDKKMIYLKLLNENLALKIPIKEGIYVIDWIKFKLDMVFTINKLLYYKQNVHMGFLHIINHTDEDYLYELKDKHDKSDTDFNNYLLWHCQFTHFGPAKLRNLYKIIMLKKQIIIPTKKKICKICKLMKIRKRINHQIGSRKMHLFKSISVNIYKFLSISLSRIRYFMKIVNQQLRHV